MFGVMWLFLTSMLGPMLAAYVDCRTACRQCRLAENSLEQLEIFCKMCEECIEMRRLAKQPDELREIEDKIKGIQYIQNSRQPTLMDLQKYQNGSMTSPNDYKVLREYLEHNLSEEKTAIPSEAPFAAPTTDPYGEQPTEPTADPYEGPHSNMAEDSDEGPDSEPTKDPKGRHTKSTKHPSGRPHKKSTKDPHGGKEEDWHHHETDPDGEQPTDSTADPYEGSHSNMAEDSDEGPDSEPTKDPKGRHTKSTKHPSGRPHKKSTKDPHGGKEEVWYHHETGTNPPPLATGQEEIYFPPGCPTPPDCDALVKSTTTESTEATTTEYTTSERTTIEDTTTETTTTTCPPVTYCRPSAKATNVPQPLTTSRGNCSNVCCPNPCGINLIQIFDNGDRTTEEYRRALSKESKDYESIYVGVS